jgi:tight adherence protein B
MRLLRARASARRSRLLAGQMHLVAAELAAHVRAGRTLAQAVGDVADELPEPAAGALRECDAALVLGMPAADALALLDGGEDGAALVAAVAMQLRVGGDLATLLDSMAEALIERDALRRAAEVATAQARATARMVASMPPVAVAALWLIDRTALVALVESPIGLAALAASGGLTVAGLVMINRIASVAP